MAIRDELLALQAEDEGGILHVAKAVDWARAHSDSALYQSLEWDDKRAAESHRFWQMRQLISIHVVAADGTPQAVSLTIDRKAGGGYRRVSDVLRAPDLREVMLQDALDELERVRMKYERVAELAKVWAEAQQIESKIGRRSRRRAAAAVGADTVAA